MLVHPETDEEVNPLSLISTIVDRKRRSAVIVCVNPLSLISTIVDCQTPSQMEKSQSSFFNFYYCRYSGCLDFEDVNPLSLISTIVDIYKSLFHLH